ncbi:Type IV pilus biogenesis protein PilE [hydrothermal vent metagenome]|uniref:Type IV pilus biogenesis protein PilE n=1 Tax=hydrothermal vent metagenome TaxID=652676 RepID=A0A3B0XBV4_9ZZZZ
MKQYNKGFTLLELMIVVAVIGILAAVAYPSYVQHIRKAECADAMNSLLSLAARMEEIYMNTNTYVGATVANTASSEGHYTLAIDSSVTDAFKYTISATPTDATQVTLTLDSLGQMAETAPGGVAGPSTAVSCLN